MKLLVAVDGSKHSEKVIDVAVGLAKSTSSDLIIMYVVPEIGIPETYRKYAQIEQLDPSSYYQAVGEQVISDMGKRAKAKAVEYEGLYEVGVPHAKVIEAAKVRKVGMIVVGLHGLHGVGRIQALGSTARRIVENSPVPVIVVPS